MSRKSNNTRAIVSRWDWDALSSLEDINVGDVDMIRRTLLFVKASTGIENPLKFFWTMVLLPYYDSVFFSHLNMDAAYLLYRLSEQVAPEVRASIEVYPTHSLEDWRSDFVEGLARGEAQIPVVLGTPPELPWV